uniref:Methyltransferase FkbM domain-containing protein n=1 Tax=Alexandrium monilatum TaxID=311494 RepID=A0A7S4Q4K7_9DINO
MAPFAGTLPRRAAALMRWLTVICVLRPPCCVGRHAGNGKAEEGQGAEPSEGGALPFGEFGAPRLRFFRERLGFKPRTVLDVGAHVGEWSRAARRIFPEAAFLLVEADPRHAPKLAETGLPFDIALLAARGNETVTFHTTRYWITTGASMFRERTAFYSDPQLSRPVPMRTHTLDELAFRRLGPECCDLLKLDVQGAEIEVLRGASRALHTAQLVLLEAAILPYNEGAPRFSELVAFMAAAGFEVVDVVDAMHCEDAERVLHFDVLFAPLGSRFLQFPFPGGIRGKPTSPTR